MKDILPKPLDILGVAITPFESYDHAADCVGQLIEARQKAFCVAINPEKIYRACKNRELMNLLNRAEIHICDGVGTAIGARILHGRSVCRITGVAMFYKLVKSSATRGWRMFLLGASQESSEGAYRKLSEQYPGLQIVGRQDGYFNDSEQVVEQINQSNADLLFVGMGSPRQELWITEHRDKINAPFCMGVGGTLDVISGHAKWAPKIFRKTGTEFLYRLIKEPKRWKRQICYPVFMLQVIKARIFGHSSS